MQPTDVEVLKTYIAGLQDILGKLKLGGKEGEDIPQKEMGKDRWTGRNRNSKRKIASKRFAFPPNEIVRNMWNRIFFLFYILFPLAVI